MAGASTRWGGSIVRGALLVVRCSLAAFRGIFFVCGAFVPGGRRDAGLERQWRRRSMDRSWRASGHGDVVAAQTRRAFRIQVAQVECAHPNWKIRILRARRQRGAPHLSPAQDESSKPSTSSRAMSASASHRAIAMSSQTEEGVRVVPGGRRGLTQQRRRRKHWFASGERPITATSSGATSPLCSAIAARAPGSDPGGVSGAQRASPNCDIRRLQAQQRQRRDPSS